MDEVWTLLLLSFIMLVGCYVSGSIPLAFSLSQERIKQVSVLGAGLLVGTALAVIIPEGVHALYDKGHDHTVHKASDDSVEKPELGSAGVENSATHEEHLMDNHTLIGVSLVLGFILMLLVDQISGGMGHTHTPPDLESSSPGSAQNRNKITATLGLVVHAAADGVALGAAASTSQTHVEMIVFFAIMLHKAPASFGLVSFLLHDGLDRTRIRKHLAFFSSSAPLFAVLTFFGLGQQSKETLNDVNATAIAMLFSGGTFLYVATVHILPELASMKKQSTAPDGTVIIHEHKGFNKCELLLMILGSVIPMFLSIGHKH